MSDFEEDQATSIISLPNTQQTERARNRAYFIVLAGSNVGEMYKLDKDELVLGRGRDANVRITEEGISRKHCMVRLLGTGDVMIEDLKSANGTFINGIPIRTHLLQDGDKIQMGSTTILKFTYTDDLDETFQRQMLEAALCDGLTKAYNRKYFHDRLDSEYAYSKRHNSDLTLLIMDIDHFKKFNDTYGHLAGDYVLKEMTKRVKESIRTEDVFARYGGEEFALICRGISLSHGAIVGERLRCLLADKPFIWHGQPLVVTMSVGVAGLPDESIKTPTELISAADKGLYEAKESGRNRVVIFGFNSRI